jgi:polyisoprenoid-binding protein YceI
MFKKLRTPLFLCLAILACKNEPKPDPAPAAPKAAAPVPKDGATTYSLSEGTVYWTSKYVLGTKGHVGTIRVASGEIWVNQGQVQFGNVTLDMNSIQVTDIKEPQKRNELETHLKDSDFFETNKFPNAEFVFTSVSPGKEPGFKEVLNGDLTMKGIAAPVTIPFKVSIEGDMLHVESASFPINRTNWGVNFKSSILGTAQDQMIDDMVAIRLEVVAKKK